MEEKNSKPLVKKTEAMNVAFDKSMPENEEDDDCHSAALHEKMMSHIAENKNIMFN